MNWSPKRRHLGGWRMDKKLIDQLKEYIDINLSVAELHSPYFSKDRMSSVKDMVKEVEIEDFVEKKQKPLFSQVLFQFIDERELGDVEVYKRARIDRRHFSKIRSNPDYNVSKNTAIALALALELDRKDIDNLLESTGYILSDSNVFDLVIQFFIEKGIYDIDLVNESLDYFKLKPLIL